MKSHRTAWLLLFTVLTVVNARAEQWDLPQALLFARTNAPDALIAQQRIVVSQAALGQANAAFWPRLQLGSSYTRTDHPVSVFGFALNHQSYSPALDFNNVPDADNLNVRGTLTIPLYAGGRNRAAQKAARAGSAAAGAEASAIEKALEYEVAQAFFTIQKTARFTEAVSSAVRSYERNQELVTKRVNAGTALKTELLDIEVKLGEAREALLRARNANALAITALKNLLGLERRSIEVVEQNSDLRVPQISEAAERPELLALSFHAEAAEAKIRQAKGAYLPSVDAFGQLDHDRGWKFNDSGNSYAVGITTRWDLWDGQLTRNRVRESESALDIIREEQRKLRLNIQMEVEQSQLRLAEANERLSVTERTIAQAEESASITRARYEQGLALSTQLIDAETSLTAARVRHAEAEADRRIAVAALRRSLGLSQLEGLQP